MADPTVYYRLSVKALERPVWDSMRVILMAEILLSLSVALNKGTHVEKASQHTTDQVDSHNLLIYLDNSELSCRLTSKQR